MSRHARRYRQRPGREVAAPWAVSIGRALVLIACAVVPLAVLAALFMTAVESDLLFVKRIDVVGNERVARDEILAAAALDRPTRILQVVPADIEAALEAHPWIVDASVVSTWQGLVHIEVAEAVPAVVVAGAGGLILTDDGGRPIRTALPEDLLAFPIATGIPAAGDNAVDERVLHEGLELYARIAANTPLVPAVRELQFEPVYGWRVVLADGAAVGFGRDAIEVRVARLADVYRALGEQGLRAERIAVDTSSLRHVAVAVRAQRGEEP